MISQLVAVSDVCKANSPLSEAKQCRMVQAQQGEPNKIRFRKKADFCLYYSLFIIHHSLFIYLKRILNE
jgi:hypothetical protein